MKIFLAPMQGLVDDVMRDLLTQIGGFDECVSEFVRITHTVHSKNTWLRHVPELANQNLTQAGVPCVVQLLGSDAPMMAKNALEVIKLGANTVDLNFGCPAPTVNKHQGGAVLLKDPDKIHHIVRTLRNSLPDHVRLTAKMRLGYENTDLVLQNAQAIEQGGASLLTVHARTKVQAYEPPAHWHWFKIIQDRVRIPIVANGDVFTLQDYVALKQQSGCEQVMLGRGALMRPDLARQIKQYERGDKVQTADFSEVMPWIRQFSQMCRRKENQNKYPMARLKQWLGMLKNVYPEAEQLFQSVRPLKEIVEIERVLNK